MLPIPNIMPNSIFININKIKSLESINTITLTINAL